MVVRSRARNGATSRVARDEVRISGVRVLRAAINRRHVVDAERVAAGRLRRWQPD